MDVPHFIKSFNRFFLFFEKKEKKPYYYLFISIIRRKTSVDPGKNKDNIYI